MGNKIHPNKYGWNSSDPSCTFTYLYPIINKFLPENMQGMAVLDLGCGNGYISNIISSKGSLVTGIDTSNEGINIAKKEYPDITFHVASVYDNILKITGKLYDFVICLEVIEHLNFPSAMLRNAYSLLKPGGKLVITTPYHGYVKNLALSVFNKWDRHFDVNWDGGHIKYFSDSTLSKMIAASGFKSILLNHAGRSLYLWKSTVICAEK